MTSHRLATELNEPPVVAQEPFAHELSVVLRGLEVLNGAANPAGGLRLLMREVQDALGGDGAFIVGETQAEPDSVVRRATHPRYIGIRLGLTGAIQKRLLGERVVAQEPGVVPWVNAPEELRFCGLSTLLIALPCSEGQFVLACVRHQGGGFDAEALHLAKSSASLVSLALKAALASEEVDEEAAESGLEVVSQEQISVSDREHKWLLRSLALSQPPANLRNAVEDWRHPLVAQSLRSAKRQARQMVQSSGRVEVNISIEHDWLRLDPAVWDPFFSAWAHVIRNAVEHGFESASDRKERGKAATGQLTLRQQRNCEGLVFEVEDDGRGIDWDAISRRAEDLGLAHSNREERIEALFSGEVTTAAESGHKGEGARSFYLAVTALGGRLEITSQPGEGSCVRAIFDTPDVPARVSFPP